MSEWIVECPQCATRFRVTPAHLAAADGLVRCGACLRVFRGSQRRVDDGAGAEPARPQQGDDLDARQARRHRSVLAGRPDDAASGPRISDPVPELDPAKLSFDAAGMRLADVTPPEPGTRRRRWPWALVAALALLALPAQYLYRNFEALALDPDTRPYLARACEVLECRLPAPVQPDAVRSKRLTVRSHPEQPGALRVEVILVNRAPWPQPFPGIELRFSDIEGEPVAARVFPPQEYLAGELSGHREMPAGTPVRIALDLQDPGPEAVNYRMRLHPPSGVPQ